MRNDSSSTPQLGGEITVDVDPATSHLLDEIILVQAARATLQTAHRVDASMSIAIVDDETSRELNARHRGIDAATDVLSFGSQSTADPPLVVPDALQAELAHYIGDLVIALPYAQRQAERYGATLAAELRLLVVHGTLHLLGYDHDTPAAQNEMWQLQATILAPFGDAVITYREYSEGL